MNSKFAQATAAAKEAMSHQLSNSHLSKSLPDEGSSQLNNVCDFSGDEKESSRSVQPDDTAFLVPLTLIDVDAQIRRSFDEDFIEHLAANIKEHGQIQAENVV